MKLAEVKLKHSTRMLELAKNAHNGQMYGAWPYEYHLEKVATLVREWGAKDLDDALAVAYGHDLLEDTAVTFNELKDRFGPTISSAIRLCTDPPGKNRKERKALLYEAFNTYLSSPQKNLAALVKCADRISNMNFSVDTRDTKKMRMYVGEFPEFLQSFVMYAHEKYPSIDILGKSLDAYGECVTGLSLSALQMAEAS